MKPFKKENAIALVAMFMDLSYSVYAIVREHCKPSDQEVEELTKNTINNIRGFATVLAHDDIPLANELIASASSIIHEEESENVKERNIVEIAYDIINPKHTHNNEEE